MIPNGSASERKEVSKLREERDILRKAAKNFASSRLTEDLGPDPQLVDT